MTSLQGKLTMENIVQAKQVLLAVENDTGRVKLDLSGVTEIDSAGVAMLSVFLRKRQESGLGLELVGVPEHIQKTLDLFPFSEGEEKKRSIAGYFEELGARAFEARNVFFEFLLLCADTAWFTVGGLIGKQRIRWNVVVYEMSAMGSRGLGVVGLIAFLVGATMALQSAAQLRQFGANIFVVDLIAISMTRELGPLMAAIVVAGRSGSAVAAEIGTMVITEEVDALKTMGLNPIRFLVVPKSIAITITQPMLTVFANVLGIFGGFLIAITYLDVGPATFTTRLFESLYLKDLLTGLVKSIMFAQLIVTIGAITGMRTKGGADAVGRSTTASVVASIFAVIVADALASLVFYFGD